MHPFIHLFIPLCNHSFYHLFIQSFIDTLFHSFTQLLPHSFIYSCSYTSLDTETVTIDGHRAVKVYRYHGNPSQRRTDKWPGNRGNFCKFVLHKENKDTMEAVCLLAKLVHAKTSSFSYAGTKDRRGVTSQEVRAYRVQAQRLKGLNKTLKGIILGNFEYVQDRLTLGQLSGNHFVITLRGVCGDNKEIEQAMTSMRDVGFINYFGLQRFGTAAIPTHHIGKFGDDNGSGGGDGNNSDVDADADVMMMLVTRVCTP